MKGAIFDLDGLLVDTEKRIVMAGFGDFSNLISISQKKSLTLGAENWKQSFDILVKAAGSPEKYRKSERSVKNIFINS